ncbi:MAG TPA: hypothetical protein VFX76_21550, partial [Roseiflexaceae bacterium]|nr:hypothetical protein [Roseiflexaceae bacterium]
MRKFLIGAAAVAAVLVPAQANAETDGYVDLAFGQTDVEGTDLDSINLGGAAAVDLSGNWRAQFDVDVNRLSEDGSATATNAAAHVYYEGPTWAVGGVLTTRDFFFAQSWSIGIEGQTHLGALVLEGEAGFGTLETFGGDTGVTNADVSATWYVTPDFSIGAGFAYFDIDEFDDELNTWGVDGEYKFQNSQFSMFAGWSQTEVEDTELDSWRIGGRYAFGDDTLQGRRSTG